MIPVWMAIGAAYAGSPPSPPPIAVDRERVAVAVPGGVLVFTEDGGVRTLPTNAEIRVLALGADRVVAATQWQVLSWQGETFTGMWRTHEDFGRLGLRVTGERVLAFEDDQIAWIDLPTGAEGRLPVPPRGWWRPHDRSPDGWTADAYGVFDPTDHPTSLSGDCHLAPGLAACAAKGSVTVYALPSGAPVRTLLGDTVLAVGAAGFVTWEKATDRTRWIGPDGVVRHEEPGRWAAAVGETRGAIVRDGRLCLLTTEARCRDLPAPAPWSPPEGGALTLVGQTETLALSPDGTVRWRAAIGDVRPPIAGRTELGTVAGLRLVANRDGSVDAFAGGKRRWSLPAASPAWGLRGQDDGLVLFGSAGEVCLVEGTTGTIVRRWRTPDGGTTSLVSGLVVETARNADMTVDDPRTGVRHTFPGGGSLVARLPDGGLLRTTVGPAVEVWDGDQLRWRFVSDRSVEDVIAVPAGDLVLIQRGAVLLGVGTVDGAVRWALPWEDRLIVLGPADGPAAEKKR